MIASPEVFRSDLARFLKSYSTAVRSASAGAGLSEFITAYRRSRRPRSTPASLAEFLNAVGPSARVERRRGGQIDIWSIAGLRRNELRTAAVLAWLLNPNGSHGQGEAISMALWRRLNARETFGFEVVGVRRSATELCPLGDTSDRVDIVLEGDQFVVFLEVKIDALEGPEQLRRYRAAARRKAAAMGKPHGVVAYLSQNAIGLPPDVLHLRWSDVGAAIDQVVRDLPDPDCAAGLVLGQFSRHAARLH